MTILKVDYTTGGDQRDNMTADELAAIRVLELDKLRRTVALQERGQKDFDEALHPRDDHGRFTDGSGDSSTPSAATLTPKPGEQISIPHTTGSIHTAYVNDIGKYLTVQEAHGGPGLEGETPEGVYSQMNVVNATDNGPPDPAQLARCEDAATKFLNDPELQPLFDEYGRPGIVVATGMVTTFNNPDTVPGENPEDANVVAQWSNGTIFLYAQTAGNPDTPVTPGFSLAGADPDLALIHEYGHQVMGVLGYDKDGSSSDFRMSFVEALSDGIPLEDHMTMAQKEEFQSNVDLETNQVSQYASVSPDEAFAEFFTALYQQQKAGADIEDSYDGGAAEALRIIRDRIAEDTKDNTTQPTLFTRTTPEPQPFDNRQNPEPGVGI